MAKKAPPPKDSSSSESESSEEEVVKAAVPPVKAKELPAAVKAQPVKKVPAKETSSE